MNILGINCNVHNSAAALLRDGIPIAGCEEERFTRIKYDGSFPEQAIRYCLAAGAISPGEIDRVVFYWKPFRGLGHRAWNIIRHLPASLAVFGSHDVERGTVGTIRDHALIGRRLRAMGISAPVVFAEHHLCHMAAFFHSGFDQAAVLSIDLAGEIASTAFGSGRGSLLRKLREIRYPHSLGVYYGALTQYLGYSPNADEYRVMGLASYGVPRYAQEFRRLLRIDPDGGFSLDLKYFSHHLGRDTWYTDAFTRLFGPPCRDEDELEAGERFRDIAASAQQVFEEAVVHLARTAARLAGSRNLVLTGGCALNGVANGRLLASGEFDGIFVPPAAYDAGCSLGAAALYWHADCGNPVSFTMGGAGLGPSFTSRECADAAARGGLVAEHSADPAAACARLIADGNVCGWLNGRAEWGPRALGHRSILADPRRSEMKEIINRKIKFREPYRPFAPSVLEECARDYFELPGPSPYMCIVVPVRAGRRAEIPAVTHVDGTARPQTVSRAQNDPYWRLIAALRDITGTPVVLNTSFNVRGEPMVLTPDDAVRCFLRTDMDYLVMEDLICRK